MFVICHYNGLLIPKQGQLLLHHTYRILFGHDQTNDMKSFLKELGFDFFHFLITYCASSENSIL